MADIIGVLPLGRPTFDVEYASEKLAQIWTRLQDSGQTLIGPDALLMDASVTRAAMARLKQAGVTRILILQVTFTDAAMTVEIANEFNMPLSIWAVPEPRLGGRLRLNAFCGLNLASHALGLAGRAFNWAYSDAADLSDADLQSLLTDVPQTREIALTTQTSATPQSDALVAGLKGTRIGRIGAHPDGFDTCAYDADVVRDLTGVEVEALELDALFDAARQQPAERAAALRTQAEAEVEGLDGVDAGELDKSLRLKLALDDLKDSGHFSAFALRCWPETFTEYGGAICGPASMMGEARVPCACEADVYGALTQMLLQRVADAPVFLVDIVDVDGADDTSVVWHCGQAPKSMASSKPQATIHTNRKMPLLYEFTLKSGPVTFFRLSQARGTTHVMIAKGQMLDRPMAFTGTSGTVRFATPAGEMLTSIIDTGMEHHMALAYGDHTDALKAVAASLDLPVYEY